MKDRCFLDTNVLVYAFIENDESKRKRAVQLLESIGYSDVFVSTQILSEFYSALYKNRVDPEKIKTFVFDIAERSNIAIIDFETIKLCFSLKDRYRFSYWDSLVLATAMENDCDIVYTEDMSHHQVIEEKIRIVNPFITT